MHSDRKSEMHSQMSSRESVRKKRLNPQYTVSKKTDELLDVPQPYQLDWEPPKDEEDEAIAEKLAELRIEVQKREVQRKFEAI